ncbi:MAG: hypothetical protein GTO17_12480 [Candidatus Aminicenantes bacterium]|nr:hypothetical protein [Candidatus Aminicenantes bacterium]
MSKYKDKPLTPEGLRTYSLKSRKSKVKAKDFAQVLRRGGPISRFIDSLPDVLAAKDFKQFLHLMGKAKEKKKAIIFALGAQVIKVGLNPILVDLMKRGWITCLALNGAGIIHDFEIAYCGQTSEDVNVQLKEGQFGMAQEPGEVLNQAIISGAEEDLGLGEAVGKMLAASDFPFKEISLLANSYDLAIPTTIHVAIGTDTIHFHPQSKGEALGKTSLKDFFLFCSLLEKIDGGGIFVNIGSAVVLPEVFLKAVTFIRNKGVSLAGFTTAVFDFIHHYRPYQNVVKRPVAENGTGFYFIGHHELMLPLLAAALPD